VDDTGVTVSGGTPAADTWFYVMVTSEVSTGRTTNLYIDNVA